MCERFSDISSTISFIAEINLTGLQPKRSTTPNNQLSRHHHNQKQQQQPQQQQKESKCPTSNCSRHFFWKFYYSFCAAHYSFNVSVFECVSMNMKVRQKRSCFSEWRVFVCVCVRCRNAKRLINGYHWNGRMNPALLFVRTRIRYPEQSKNGQVNKRIKCETHENMEAFIRMLMESI